MPENPYINTQLEDLINEVRHGQQPIPLLNTPDAKPSVDPTQMSQGDSIDYMNASLGKIFNQKESPLLPTPIKATDIDTTGRFDKQSLGWDNEDIYGQIQSNWNKAANGLLKGVTLAGTTFIQGTLGLAYGVGAAIGRGELNGLYNNDLSNELDGWNKSLENSLPNYYSARERNAEWWEPANLLTANFVWDKFVKNLGFSLGALYSGAAVAKALSLVPSMFNLSLTKNAIQAADAIEQSASIANPLNKLNNVTNTIRNMSNSVNAANNLTSPINRMMVSTLGAVTEGGIEALQGVNEHRNQLIEEYKKKYGYSPIGEELARIDNVSENLGNARFGLNLLLLTGTNYIQLPKILGSSYKASKAAANGLEDTLNPIIKDGKTGLFKSALPEKGIGKLVRKARNISSLFFSPTEAFEEASQYAIEKGVNNYYNKAYRGEGRDFIESIGEGYKAALSDKEGLESLIIGGLSGGIQQAGFISTKGIGKTGNIAQRGFTGYGGEKATNTTSLVNSLNDKTKQLKFKSDAWLKDQAEATARGINLQRESEKYIRQGDVLEAKDNEFDYLHNYLTPRIKYGRYDLVKEDVDRYRQLAATDLEFLKQNGIANENDTQATFMTRLNNFEKHVDNVQSLYQSLNLRYAGLVDSNTKERVYPDEVIDKMVYAASKVADYDQRITELSNNLSAKGISIYPIIDSIIKENKTSEEAIAQALKQINNLSIISENRDDLKEQLQDVIELSLRRKHFLSEYDKIKKNPTSFAISSIPVFDNEATITQYKTKLGEGTFDKTLEINRDYQVGYEPIAMIDGKLRLSPRMRIISKTLGGEYEVVMPSGETTFMTPTQFVDYPLSDKLEKINPRIEELAKKAILQLLRNKGYKDEINDETSLSEMIDFINNIKYNFSLSKSAVEAVNEATKEIVKQLEEERRQREKFEANKKLQEQLFASQSKGDQAAGVVNTPPSTTTTTETDEDYARAPLYNFLSKESMYESGEMKLHQQLRNNFLLNFDNFTEEQQSKIRVITVTRDNESPLGLKGFIDYALQGYSLQEGEIPIVKLYITAESNGRFLIGEDGEKLNKQPLGKEQDYSLAVFGMFHEPNFGEYKFGSRKGKIAYSKGTPEELIELLPKHKIWRNDVIEEAKKGRFKEYEISGISRGRAEINRDVNGNPIERNSVVGTLIKEADLNKPLIQIPTKENDIQVKIEGKSLNLPIGQPVFVNGSTIEPLLNRQFSQQEANNIYNIIHHMSKQVEDQGANFKELPDQHMAFLRGILYWRTPTGNPGRNQIWIDNTGHLRLGNQAQSEINTIQFTPESISSNKDKLLAFLTGAYNNVNDIKLKDLQKPFISLSLNQDGTLRETEHPNYQTFLLTGDDPLLATNIRKKSSSVPNDTNYRYKYSVLRGREFERPQTVVKEEPKLTQVSQSTTTITVKDSKFPIDYTIEDGQIFPVTNEKLVVLTDFLKTTKNSSGKLMVDALKERNPQFTDEDASIALATTLIKKEQGAQPVAQPQPTTTSQDDLIKQEIERLKKEMQGPQTDWKDSQFRVVSEVEGYKPIDLQKELSYISNKLPFSTEILHDIIQTPDGAFAWGKYKDLTISLYEKAQEGTGYHEAFEGVWDMFTTSQEKRKLISEFNKRSGSFLNRATGQHQTYSSANPEDAKEQIADEFADYILNDIKPPKANTSLIERWFRNIWNFIKSIFSGDVQTIDQLFSRINSGRYRTPAYKNTPSPLNQYSKDYRIGDLDFTKTYQITRGMVAEVVQRFLQDSRSLVEFDEKSQASMTQLYQYVYNRLEDFYTKAIFDPNTFPQIANNSTLLESYYKIWKNISGNWDKVKQLTNEYLKLFDIVVDENTEEDDNDAPANENADRNEYMKDSFKVDGKKNAAKSIRLLISTISEAAFDTTNQSASISDSANDKPVLSIRTQQTGMQQLINFTKTFNNLLANLHTYNTLDEKLNKLDELRKSFPNYQRLWKRLNSSTDNLLYDWKLKVKFYNVFAKQKPEAVIMYVQPDGGSYSGKANIQDTIAVTVQGWIDNLKQKALNKETDIVKYDDQGNFFLEGAKLKSPISTLDEKLIFLAKLDISFSKDEFSTLSSSQKEAFSNAVAGFHKDITLSGALSMENSKTLNSVANLATIAESKIVAGAEFDSVFPNLEGEFVQTFILPNAVSKDVNNINNALTIEDLLKKMPQLQAPYAQDSIYMNEIFFKDGKRTNADVYIQYIQGTVFAGERKSPNNNLSQPFRLSQEINQNLNGAYYILLPADGSTEWMIQLGNHISYSSLRDNTGPTWNRIYSIFSKYLETEKKLFEVDGKHRLLSELSNKYTASEEEFKQSLSKYVNNITDDTFDTLSFYGITQLQQSGLYKFNNIDKGFTTSNGLNFEQLTENQVKNILKFRTINAIINNIEIQKLFFGDVAEFQKASDKYENRFRELFKRIKSFLSPRESSVYGSEKFNKFLNESNKIGNITLSKSDPGYHENTDVITTVTLDDIITTNEELGKQDKAYEKNNTTDAQAWAPLPSYKEIVIKSGFRWTDKHEQVYQYRMSKDRLLMEEDKVYKYTNEKLKEHDKKTVADYVFPNVYFPVLKPIVSGHTITNEEYHSLLDKDSVVPTSYSYVRGTNFQPHYLKMLKQQVGYAIVTSGRKVGNKGMDIFYNEDGSVNESPYTNFINVRFEDFGIQQETSGKKDNQTRGSQLTKLITLNLYDGGIPTSPEVESLVQENINILTEQTNNGYQRLIKKLGIVDNGSYFTIENKSKVLDLLKNELLRREVTTNIKEALNLTEDGEFITSFEALPNYRQIKNILFSYVEKYISRPKVSGGPKVQVSGALMEKLGVKRSTINGKPALTSDKLKFYTEDNPKMEVLLPFYASKLLRKAGIKFKDEQELLEIINKSPDAKEILSGVGFRIPTQEINSVDSFIIKGFLPEEMGDTIVVPEELTTKAGSDFDVDKLQTYLRNLYIDNRKQIRVVPYFGIGQKAKDSLKAWLSKDVAEDILLDIPAYIPEDPFENIDFEQSEEQATDKFEAYYAQSIENGYYTNLEKILALPQNFKRLIQPNSSDELISYRDALINTAPQEFDTEQIKSIINPLYISQLRHIYLTGKSGVGIAAVQQTSNAVSQLTDITIDPARINLLKDRNERIYIKNGLINLPHNKNKDGLSTISKTLDQANRYISDKISQYINGFVDVAKDPFIIQIGANKVLAGTFMTLERFGVPSDIVVYFMNQPIVREYMKLLDKNQNTFMYNDKNIETIKARFNRGRKSIPTSFAEKGLADHLLKSIDNFYNDMLTEEQNAEQHFIFDEFLKYYVIGQNMLRLNQGTNYDTQRFTSDYSIVFKELQYQDTTDNNIFSSSDKFLNASFIGNIRQKLLSSAEAINTISTLKSAKPTLYQIATDFKRNFAAKPIIGNLIEESYISHLIQTKLRLNNQLEPLILSTENAVVSQMRRVRREATGDIANNILLTQLIPAISKRKGTKNVRVTIRPKDVFTKELYTEAFQELYEHPLTQELARNLAKLSFLQSGVSNSVLSMKEFLPTQMYTTTVNQAVAQSSPEEAQTFKDIGGFYRNSWSNENIIPSLEDPQDENFDYKYTFLHPQIRAVAFALPSLKRETKSKYITLIREDYQSAEPIRYKFLAKRVDNANGEPIIHTTYNEFGYPQYKILYTPINAWGDGFRAQEYYNTVRESVFNNGYIKIPNELTNEEVVRAVSPNERDTLPSSETDGDVQDKINDCLK